MRMFSLELKRVLKTRTTWILLVLSLLLTLLLAYIPTTFHSYSWTEADGQNTELKGMDLIQYKKDSAEQFSGDVTAENVGQALEEYQSCLREYGVNETYDLPRDVYVKRILPLEGILHGLPELFADPNTGFAPSLMDIDPLQVEEYYARCDRRLDSVMKMENPSAQQNAKEAYSRVEKPYMLYPGYDSNALDYQILLSILVMIFCCVICAPIFTSDYQTGADDILRCTKHGRHHLAIIKILSALCISFVTFTICTAAYILISDTLFGWETTKTSLQMLYSITTLEPGNIGRLQVLTVLRSVLPLLAIISLILFISTKTRNNAISMALSLLICVLPNFLSGFLTGNLGSWILYAIPSSAFGMQTNMLYSAVGFEFLHLGSLSFRPVDAMLFFCAIEIPLFIFLAIHAYSKNQR